MSTSQDRIEKFLEAYPASVAFDDPEPMKTFRTIPQEGRGSGIQVPYYCAGFFLHPSWWSTYRDERKLVNQLDYHILKLPGAEELDRSLRVLSYGDETHCRFLCMHNNLAKSDGHVQTRDWLARRNEQLNLLCKLMELDEEEIEMAKKNFAWHMFRPRPYGRVPLRITLHKPSELKEFHKLEM